MLQTDIFTNINNTSNFKPFQPDSQILQPADRNMRSELLCPVRCSRWAGLNPLTPELRLSPSQSTAMIMLKTVTVEKLQYPE